MSTHPADTANIVILGLGNTLLQDEGVGVHVANRLKSNYRFSPEVTIIDGGTFGLDLLPYIENKEHVILIDAVNFNQKPGYVERISKTDILTQLNTLMSVHHLGITDVLSTAKLLDKEPKNICMVGIQPKSIEAGLEMTSTMKNSVEHAINIIIEVLNDIGIIATDTKYQQKN